jgi:hypothetical protein
LDALISTSDHSFEEANHIFFLNHHLPLLFLSDFFVDVVLGLLELSEPVPYNFSDVAQRQLWKCFYSLNFGKAVSEFFDSKFHFGSESMFFVIF